MDDHSLLRDYAATRSPRAFAQLVERHVDLVYSAALRRMQGDPHRASEVTQMVFIDLTRKATQLAGHPALTGWLHASTGWAAANLRRAERRRLAREQAAAWQDNLIAGDGNADWQGVRSLLDEALDQLREADRSAVLWRFFSNLSFAEIAGRLGTSENAARMRVDRALEKLHRLLQRKGVKTGAAALALALSQNAVSAAPVGLAASLTTASLAAGTGTATGNLLAILLMNKISYSVMAALAVGFGVGLWQQCQARTAATDALAELRREQAARRLRIDRLAARVTQRQDELARFAPANGSPAPNLVEVERKQLDLVIRRGELDNEYAAVFRRLQLDPSTLSDFKTLLVQRAQAVYDGLQLAKAEGVEVATYAENEALAREAAGPVDRQIAELIGLEKFVEFQKSIRPFNRVPPAEAGDPGRWVRADALGDLFARTGADSQEEAFARNSLAGPLPDAFVQPAKELMTPDEYRRLLADQERAGVVKWMDEIARSAAAAGRLKLSKSSQRIYGVPNPATPVRP